MLSPALMVVGVEVGGASSRGAPVHNTKIEEGISIGGGEKG